MLGHSKTIYSSGKFICCSHGYSEQYVCCSNMSQVPRYHFSVYTYHVVTCTQTLGHVLYKHTVLLLRLRNRGLLCTCWLEFHCWCSAFYLTSSWMVAKTFTFTRTSDKFAFLWACFIKRNFSGLWPVCNWSCLSWDSWLFPITWFCRKFLKIC